MLMMYIGGEHVRVKELLASLGAGNQGERYLHAFLLLGVDSGLVLGDDDRHSLFGDRLEKN